MNAINTKLAVERVVVSATEATERVAGIFRDVGCTEEVSLLVAMHLADSSLSGVESHGLMRTLQYVEQFESGSMRADATARETVSERGMHEIDGGGGIGIPAMHLAGETACRLAADAGLAALPVRNVGHTGRLGAFAEKAAASGCLVIIIGGGNRKEWRQVAPHGGRQGLLPTNPYCIGIPGGDQGPVILDFATSRIAGGWIYAARSAGANLPEDCVIDANGNPTVDPEDYFNGGAILPACGPKGYALAVVAEMIGEALLGPVAGEANSLMIALDASRFREPTQMQAVAEEILSELRSCPPAPGFDRVEVPGEREGEQRRKSAGKIAIPVQTWEQINVLARRLGARSEGFSTGC